MLLCGWSPPAGARALAVQLHQAGGLPADTACRRPTGQALSSELGVTGMSPAWCEPCSAWLCDGISLSSSVTVSEPPVSPRSCSDRPGPWPGCIGALALHVRQREVALAVAAIGGAEQREQRGVLRERQDLPVAKRPALGREVEREDADFGDERIHGLLLGLAREDAEQRDDEIDAEIGLEVGVRLAAADVLMRCERPSSTLGVPALYSLTSAWTGRARCSAGLGLARRYCSVANSGCACARNLWSPSA